MLQLQDQSLRPVTTAHLAQTMSLLVLSNMELRDKVLAELNRNPALELVEDRICPSCQKRLIHAGPCPKCSQPKNDDSPIVFVSPRESIRPMPRRVVDDEPADHEPAAPEDLAIHVLQQISSDLKEDDRKLALYIIASLDEDGFLQDPPVVMARATRASITQIERVTQLISHADPPGLATQGPREALLAQLDLFADDDPRIELARFMISQTFKELGRRDYVSIAEQAETSASQVRKAVSFISENLNPYPARAFWSSGRGPQNGDPNVYHSPDIQISHQANNKDGPLVVEIFSAISGWLRVNQAFRKALSRSIGEKSDEWSEHLEKASLFVKCIQQRNNTMRRLMEILVCTQGEFILKGDRHLIPITRATIAKEIGVHESTISRAVAHKSVALPDGRIIPLSRFFDRSLSVRDRIKEIVEKEKVPLTDDQIVIELEKDGVKIARRTVAKYRSMDGILPARLRLSQNTKK
jgi:RNA polymerase sigma-54 factor